MPPSTGIPDDELARARLAFISAGQPALSAPRRALVLPEPQDRPSEAAAASAAPGAVPSPSVPALPPGVSEFLELALRRRYAVAVLVLLLVGTGITMAVLGRSSASQVELDQPPAVHSASPPVTQTPTTAPEPVLIRVHVLGAVASPGVVSLDEGAIVADALQAAGGLSPDADPAELNLAARLSDGQQVIVGTTTAPQGDVRDQPGDGAEGDAGEAGTLLNLNSATAAQLEELPGVGPVLAGEIIAWREGNGGFHSVSDLQEVSGIGPKTFGTLQPLVTV